MGPSLIGCRMPTNEFSRLSPRAGEEIEFSGWSSMVVYGALVAMMSGTAVYYHCAFRHSTILSLLADVFIVLLCSLAILGLLFRHMAVGVPVDPLHWQISQSTAASLFACLANTVGAAESVLRVAATGHDKRLFLKVVCCLYLLSVLGRALSGVTVAYIGLCLFCIYVILENSGETNSRWTVFLGRRNTANSVKEPA